MPARALGCIRVSTRHQAEKGYSIPEQDASIRGCCERHGLQLQEILVDDGVTGRILERPAIRKITELAEAGAFDVLILVKINRLGRENAIIQQLLSRFRDRGIRMLFVEHGSGDTKEERLQLGILSAMAEYEWDNLREVTTKGRARKAKAGKVPVFCEAFGYHTITKAEALVLPEYAGRDGELVPIEEEARWVREAYRRIAAGGSLRGVARWLNECGVRTKRGNPWTHQVLRGLLENPLYAGRFYYGRRAFQQQRELTAGGRPKVERSPRPAEEWISIEVPALVDEETWRQVQDRLVGSLELMRGRPVTVWPLKGCIVCGVCVTRYERPRACVSRRTHHNKAANYGDRSYVCATKSEDHLAYCGSSWRAKDLEARALAEIRAAVVPGELGRRVRALLEARRRETEPAELRIEKLHGEVTRLKGQEEKLLDTAIRLGFSDDVVAPKLQALQQQRREVEAQLRDVSRLLSVSADPDEASSRAEEAAAAIRAEIEAAAGDLGKLSGLFRRLVQIVLWPDGREPDIRVNVEAALQLG